MMSGTSFIFLFGNVQKILLDDDCLLVFKAVLQLLATSDFLL